MLRWGLNKNFAPSLESFIDLVEMKTPDRLLNSTYLKNRIAELGIKQWWLAEQVGVDRKTVVRWVQGQVKSIQKENVEALAKILDCSVAELTLSDQAEQIATIQDQKNAAALLATSSFIEKLGPIGEWNVIESLLKATIVPDLPLNVLGELYNQLCVASWRQSKIEQAEVFNRKAEEIALKTGDKQLLAAALISKANLLSWRGKVGSSIQIYRECIKLERFIEPRSLGSAYSNLGAVLYESGDFEAGETFEKKAIEIFSFHGKPTNLSIAWCHLAILYLQKGDEDPALDACKKSAAFALQDDYRRGVAMCELIRSESFAVQKRKAEALASLEAGLDQFSKLMIEEGLNYEFAGRISRLVGHHSESVRFLERGISISSEFPMALASLQLELARTLSMNPTTSSEARKYAETAATLFKTCEAPIRSRAAKQFKDSIA